MSYFRRRWPDLVWVAIDVALIWFFLAVVTSCRNCAISGPIFYCNTEGPHELVQNPPIAWRQRAMDVQRALYAWTKLHAPSDSTRFVWRDSSTLIFVRVLRQGIPDACARTNGDTVLFDAGYENDRGVFRHEFIHWVQPGNAWLAPGGNIHDPSVFASVGAPLTCG